MLAQSKPTPKQFKAWQYLLDDKTYFILFGGGAGGGKSWLGCEWLIGSCLNYPETRWFIGRKELSRLMKSSFITFIKVCKFHNIPKESWKLNGQYNFIEFKNGSRIDLLDLDYKPSDPNYDRFGSLEYTGGWIEEAGEVKFGVFDVLKTRIGRHLNAEYKIRPKMLITCNPSKNWLYRVIYKPYRKKELEKEYAFIQSLYGDNPFTAEIYGKMLTQIKDKNTKQRLMYGNWEYEDDPNCLIEYDAITDIFTNPAEYSEDKYLTSDIARYGQDKTITALWKGWDVYRMIIHSKRGIDETSDFLRQLMRDERIPYSHSIVDEGGVGGGVVDNLRGIKGFVANRVALPHPKTAEKENYRNIKAQCSYMFADKVNKREVSISAELTKTDEERIIEELEQIRGKEVERDAPLEVIAKPEVKEMIGRSPDFSDCLIQRIYFELDKTLGFKPSIFRPNWSIRRRR